MRVFDISQTEGDDLPELAWPRWQPGPRLAMLEEVVRNRRIKPEYGELPSGTLGVSAKGMIVIQSGLEPADTFAVLTYQLAHELLRQLPALSRFSRSVRDTEAGAVSHVICYAVGLYPTRSSADYRQLYNGDLTALNGSLQAIHNTAAQILGEMSRAEAVYCAREASFVAA